MMTVKNTYFGSAKYRKLSVKYLIDLVIIKLRIKKKKSEHISLAVYRIRERTISNKPWYDHKC